MTDKIEEVEKVTTETVELTDTRLDNTFKAKYTGFVLKIHPLPVEAALRIQDEVNALVPEPPTYEHPIGSGNFIENPEDPQYKAKLELASMKGLDLYVERAALLSFEIVHHPEDQPKVDDVEWADKLAYLHPDLKDKLDNPYGRLILWYNYVVLRDVQDYVNLVTKVRGNTAPTEEGVEKN